MSNKSIAKYVVGYVNRKRYGITTGRLSPKPLVDTYTEGSNCTAQTGCETPQPCEDDIVYKICNFSIGTFIFTEVNYYKIKLTIPAFWNGVEPYEVLWSYDSETYELVEQTGTYIILNRLKDAEFTSIISVKVIDKDGCFAYQEYEHIFVPIEFVVALTCLGIGYNGTFVAGTPSTGNVVCGYTIQGYGDVSIRIGDNTDGFSGSVASFPVTPGNGSTSFPLAYDGTGTAGEKTLSVVLSFGNSTSSCTLLVTVNEPVIVLCTAAQNMVIEVT